MYNGGYTVANKVLLVTWSEPNIPRSQFIQNFEHYLFPFFLNIFTQVSYSH